MKRDSVVMIGNLVIGLGIFTIGYNISQLRKNNETIRVIDGLKGVIHNLEKENSELLDKHRSVAREACQQVCDIHQLKLVNDAQTMLLLQQQREIKDLREHLFN